MLGKFVRVRNKARLVSLGLGALVSGTDDVSYTSRELLIAGRPIAGAPKSNSLVVMLPLAHSLLFAGDKLLSPAHSTCIHQYGWGGPQRLGRHIGIFIPGAYSSYAPGIDDLPPANRGGVRRG
jgi:hypothetical protein